MFFPEKCIVRHKNNQFPKFEHYYYIDPMNIPPKFGSSVVSE
jgi:hypothetical protein